MCARSSTTSTSGGFESLRPRYRGGRPRRISTEQQEGIVSLAGARPDTLGVPPARWSLPKLEGYLREQGIVVSLAHVGACSPGPGSPSSGRALKDGPRSRLRGRGSPHSRPLAASARRWRPHQLRRARDSIFHVCASSMSDWLTEGWRRWRFARSRVMTEVIEPGRFGAHETRGAVEHIHFEALENGHVVENTRADIVP
jgi:hypothetical protein